MKKSLVTHIVVMIIAVIIGGYLASLLTAQRADIIKVQISQTPLGGFNKFASDVQWMLFINYCGGLESVKKENVEEIYSRLKSILGNDPNQEAAYELGGMMFSVRDPQKAVEIFTQGANNPNLKHSWRLPFYAGFVLTQHMTDKENPNRFKDAEKMFRMAISRDNTMPHVFSALIRTRAKQLLKDKQWKDGTPIVDEKHAYLCALFDEWRQSGGVSESGPGGEIYSGSGDAVTVSDFRPRLLEAAQKAKASAPGNKDVLKTIDKVLQKVLKDDHLCGKCLTPYTPGDRFCAACGVGVAVYGICPQCRAVVKGEFCSKCGYDKKNPVKRAPRHVRRAPRIRPAAPVKAAPVVAPVKVAPVTAAPVKAAPVTETK